jgi:hypothetical protein
MSPRSGSRLAQEQRRALNHPLRLRLMEMHQRMEGRPLSVETLTAILSETPEYRDVTAAEVKYHQARLQDAKLIPVG